MKYIVPVLLGILLTALPVGVSGKTQPGIHNDSVVYVWNFSVSDPSIDYIGEAITSDFETELINSGFYTVLERRRYDRVLTHQKMENRVARIENLSQQVKDSLVAINAAAVFFGEIFHDTTAGVYNVTVKLQKLNGEIPKKNDLEIGQADILVPRLRKSKMKELVAMLHASEFIQAKREEYDKISGILATYIVHAKNVHNAFNTIARYALEDQSFFGELNATIIQYNSVFEELKGNYANYHMSFKDHWTRKSSDQLYDIFEDILNKIHDNHIMGRLNVVRNTIIEFRTAVVEQKLSKSEISKRKEKLTEDINRITRDLYIEIQSVDKDINSFLKQLKEEMES